MLVRVCALCRRKEEEEGKPRGYTNAAHTQNKHTRTRTRDEFIERNIDNFITTYLLYRCFHKKVNGNVTTVLTKILGSYLAYCYTSQLKEEGLLL